MSDFEQMKKKIIETNDQNYGKEIKAEYGEEVYEATNNIISGLTEQQWKDSEEMRITVEDMLRRLTPSGDPKSRDAQEMAALHGKWASTFWQDGMYSHEAHVALVSMYTEDERFKSYYDAIAPGAAAFLREAVEALDAEDD